MLLFDALGPSLQPVPTVTGLCSSESAGEIVDFFALSSITRRNALNRSLSVGCRPAPGSDAGGDGVDAGGAVDEDSVDPVDGVDVDPVDGVDVDPVDGGGVDSVDDGVDCDLRGNGGFGRLLPVMLAA